MKVMSQLRVPSLFHQGNTGAGRYIIKRKQLWRAEHESKETDINDLSEPQQSTHSSLK
jgi:hypothetical protein